MIREDKTNPKMKESWTEKEIQIFKKNSPWDKKDKKNYTSEHLAERAKNRKKEW